MINQYPLLLRAEQIAANLQSFSHLWNSNFEIAGTQLGRMVGLKRTGVGLVKVPPGKESFIYHVKGFTRLQKVFAAQLEQMLVPDHADLY